MVDLSLENRGKEFLFGLTIVIIDPGMINSLIDGRSPWTKKYGDSSLLRLYKRRRRNVTI